MIVKEIDGQKCEPMEELTIVVPEEFSGKAIELATQRKGEIKSIDTLVVLSLIHISEPTRLALISYAVFCLKKKNERTCS